MSARIAFCGLDCALCPAFLATSRKDQGLRRKTAQEWSQIYDSTIEASQINCLGCQQCQGPRFFICQHCTIRSCGLGRGLPTCADCPDYPCPQLKRLLDLAPTARDNLEALRRREGRG
ncbi:MAG: DUF3795 domain-containing protein [Desulfarculus sp.]|nr:DUF3795 domain-containing protein [Desulfarculus sp.]